MRKNFPVLSFWNNLHLDIYNRCINPHTQQIDWYGFEYWFKLKGLEDRDESADYLLFMRRELNNETDKIRSIESDEKESYKEKDESNISDFERALIEKKKAKKEKKEKKEVVKKEMNKQTIDEILIKSGKYFK